MEGEERGKKAGHKSETSNMRPNGRRRPLDVPALTGSDSWRHLKIIFSQNFEFINSHEGRMRTPEKCEERKGLRSQQSKCYTNQKQDGGQETSTIWLEPISSAILSYNKIG